MWAGKTSPRRPERGQMTTPARASSATGILEPAEEGLVRVTEPDRGRRHTADRPGGRPVHFASRCAHTAWTGLSTGVCAGGHRTGCVDDRLPRAQPRERLSSRPRPRSQSRAQLRIVEQQRQSPRQAHDIVAREEEAGITNQLGTSSRRRGNDRQSRGQTFEDGQRARLIPARRDHLNVTCTGARSGRPRGARGRAAAPSMPLSRSSAESSSTIRRVGVGSDRPQLVSPTNWMAKSLRSWAKTRHARRNVSGAFSTQIRPTNPKTGTRGCPPSAVRRSKCGCIHPVDGHRSR